ncbi:hypothetical protein HPB49_002141 [Dermacentor silvarum]|uniref:Uncharacterized protein n=1 Tax=Dermacentor silvarum TaxID=543639 RepID=A0ACB8CNR6_DERSI|nr:hypothetical protein HPB49_002141 [Dermacentor silvarum]
MLRWSLEFSAYNYELFYVPGSKLSQADVFSRLPLPVKDEYETPLADIVPLEAGPEVPLDSTKIAALTRSDPVRYPGRLYETAAKALILEYPALKDTIGTGWDMHPALHFEGTNTYEARDITVVFEAFNIEVIDIIAGMTAVMKLY